jgi:hypothetical protein
MRCIAWAVKLHRRSSISAVAGTVAADRRTGACDEGSNEIPVRHGDGGLKRAVSLLIALAVVPSLCAQTVNDVSDRITGERTVIYTADGSTDTTRPVVTFLATFQGEVASSLINLAFVTADPGTGLPAPRFAGCHDIEWFVDGQALPSAAASHRGRVVDGEMIEMIEQQVEVDWLLRIASSHAVRYRVCRSEYLLTDNDLQAFARIASKLKGATYSRSASPANVPAASGQPTVEYQGMQWRPRNQETMFPKRR